MIRDAAPVGCPPEPEPIKEQRQGPEALNPATPQLTEARPVREATLGNAPEFDPRFVRRPRLTKRLLGSLPARIVLLTAPAGYAKTTSLAEWAAVDRRPFAWVAASERHDDPAVLIASIVEALEEIEPVDPGVLAALASPNPSLTTVVLPRLGEALRQRRETLVLVVDDLHTLSSPEAFEVFDTVIESLPAGAQLALASRSEPPLHLGQMRAHRLLAELPRGELAMTRAESGELLANLGLELSSAQLDVLFERTEGWPAALYLAGLSLIDQADIPAAVASFAGDDRIVVDYLRDEFLSTINATRLKFLTRSSLLDELSGPLCDAVLERSGSARLLRDLARSNFLVVPLDRRDARFRLHHLFGEMLRSELRRREPELEQQLHARASRWYAEHSDPDRAIEHAIAAREIERAGELIWQAFPELSGRGRIATLDRWLDHIGEDGIAASSSLALASTHRNLALGQGERAAHWARIARSVAEASPEGLQPIEADLRLLRATLASEGVVQMGKDAARASELLPNDGPWQSPCYFYRGVASQLTGHPRRALPLLQEASRRGAVVSPLIQTLALSQLCLIAVDEDDWDMGSRLVAQAREQVQRCGLTDYPSTVIVQATSALVRSQQGQVERAQEDLADATRLLAILSDFPPWYETEVRIVMSRACARLDEIARGRALLDEASRFLALTEDAAILAGWLAEAATALRSGAVQEGRDSLTGAELRTLQYLPSHLSFREIGDGIHVSPNTVKTQAQAIYRKLGASSRGEAVERARAAGLLGEEPGTSFEPGDTAPSRTSSVG